MCGCAGNGSAPPPGSGSSGTGTGGTEALPQHGGFQELRTHVLTSKSGSSSRSTIGKLFGTDGAKLP